MQKIVIADLERAARDPRSGSPGPAVGTRPMEAIVEDQEPENRAMKRAGTLGRSLLAIRFGRDYARARVFGANIASGAGWCEM